LILNHCQIGDKGAQHLATALTINTVTIRDDFIFIFSMFIVILDIEDIKFRKWKFHIKRRNSIFYWCCQQQNGL